MLTRLLRRCRKEEGFTLIELLVVVAIIALLTAFAVPRIYDAISKARVSRGQSDMDTISGSLDRYNFDKEYFPKLAGSTAADAAKIKEELGKGYLKQTAKFQNGWERGYIYLTNANGEFYVLVDPKNQALDASASGGTASTVTVKCNNLPAAGIAVKVSTDFTVQLVGTDFSKDDVAKGCSVTPATAAFVTN